MGAFSLIVVINLLNRFSFVPFISLCFFVYLSQISSTNTNLASVTNMTSNSNTNSLSSVILSYENLIHALSGALGSTVALSIFYPLDTVRIYQQLESTKARRDDSSKHAQDNDSKSRRESKSKRTHGINKEWIEIAKDVIAKRGVGGLYNGLGAVNKSICVSNFIYFYTYHALKKLALEQGFTQHPALNLILGMISGTVNVLTTTPLWVANTRIKLQGSKFAKSEDGEKNESEGLLQRFD